MNTAPQLDRELHTELYDIHFPRHPPPERSLWAAVILRAIQDLESEDSRIREDAVRFLFSGCSHYKKYRTFVFRLAGIRSSAIPKRKELYERAAHFLTENSGYS